MMAQLVRALVTRPDRQAELDLWGIMVGENKLFTNFHVHIVACMNVRTHSTYIHKYIQITIYSYILHTNIYKCINMYVAIYACIINIYKYMNTLYITSIYNVMIYFYMFYCFIYNFKQYICMHICVCGIHEYIIWILYKIKAFRWNILDGVLVKLHLLSQSHWALPSSTLSQPLLSVGSFYLHLLGHNRARGWDVGGAEALGTSSWMIPALGVNALGISVEISFSGEWSLKAAKKACLGQRTEIAAMILHLLTAQWWVY